MKKRSQQKLSAIASFSANGPIINSVLLNKKLPSWAAQEGLIFPTRLCLEQCSGEKSALYKSELISRLFPDGGATMADLTGGLGVDFSFVSRHFKKGIYIEQQHDLCEAAKNNFPKLGLNHVEFIEGNGIEKLSTLPDTDLIFIDPARRDHIGKKTILIEECEPDVTALLPMLWKKTSCIMLKLSPMLDLTRATKSLQNISEIHIVADGSECKELLLILQRNASQTKIFCHNQQWDFSFLPHEETEAQINYTSEVKRFLYEPGVALLKAGAFKLIGQHYCVEKLHPNSHLYTSEVYIPNFPGRSFEVMRVCGFGKKELKTLCNSVEKANLTIRNFPGSVAELRKRLKLKEGGDAYWFATTLSNEKHVIIDCRKYTQ